MKPKVNQWELVMMREREKEAFLNTIIETPDDDTARLVYADWLDENGEPERAEFIRVQIQLASAEGEERARLMEREAALLRQHRGGWMAEFAGVGVYRLEFHRGFVEEIHATATAFLRRGAAWAERAPLRDVRLTATMGRGADLAACRHLAAVRGLTIYDQGFGDADLTALSGAPNLGGLRSLDIGGTGSRSRGETSGASVGSRGVETFARTVASPTLTHLRIHPRGDLDREALAALLGGRALPALRALALRSCVTDVGAMAIADGAAYPNLEELNLNWNRIGVAGALALLNPGRAARLRTLGLLFNPILEDIVDLIAARELPSQQRVIRFQWGDFDIDHG